MDTKEKRIQELPMASTRAVIACAGEPTLTNYEGPVVALCSPGTYGYWRLFEDYITGRKPNIMIADPAPKISDVFTPGIHILTKWMVACILDAANFSEPGYRMFVKSPFEKEGSKQQMIHRVSNSELYTAEDLVDHSGVAVVIHDKSREKVLMQKHVKIGKWTIPAGKVAPGSSLDETIREEIFDETGLTVKRTVFLNDRLFVYKKNGVIVNTHSHVFEALEYVGTLENKEPEKHSEQLFILINDIYKLPDLSDVTRLWLGIPDGV